MSLLLGFILSIFVSFDLDYGISTLAKKCKDYFISHLNDDKQEHMAYGMILMIAFSVSAFVITALVLSLINVFSSIVGIIAEAVVFCATLNVGKILKKTFIVCKKDDCDSKEAKEICENVALSINDEIIAPVIFMAIGGAAAAVLYRVIVSVKNAVVGEEEYKFNKFSVRIYDIVNFIPLRISVVLIFGACRILGYNYNNAIDVFWSGKAKHNGNDMILSIFEGALNLHLGTDLKDYTNQKPSSDTKAGLEDVKKSMRIMCLAVICIVVLGVVVRYILT